MKQGGILDSLFKRKSPALKDLVDEINAAASSARNLLLEEGFSDADIDDAIAGGAAMFEKIVDDPRKHKAADYSLQVLEIAAAIRGLVEKHDFLDNPRRVATAIGLAFQCGLGFGMNPMTRSADFKGEYFTALAKMSHQNDRAAERIARDRTRKYWIQNPNQTIANTTGQMQVDLQELGWKNYAHDTVYDWIKNLAPPHIRRGGRPKGS